MSETNLAFRPATRKGRLVLIQTARRNGKPAWECRCDCGAICVVRTDHLRGGATQSCGCKQSEMMKHGLRFEHGDARRLSKTPEWKTWVAMIQRCTDPNSSIFHRYGARGITVCGRWLNSFEAFLLDMGRRPTPKHTIERDDNDGPYAPENCRWATRKEQANNRRTSRIVEADGRRMTLSQWQDATGIHQLTLLARLRRGWSEERTISTPLIRHV